MTRDDAAAALKDVLDLVAPDGAGLELLSVDNTARSIELKLDLDNVECLECVLPRDYLERLALSMFQQSLPELQQVAIVDPREQN
jgi:hypothetical protein